jgi:predicted transcriptional regulator
MSHEVVLAALPNTKEEARSLKDIAEAIGLEISTHTDWIRAERRLTRSLRALIKWGWVTCDKRQSENGYKFRYSSGKLVITGGKSPEECEEGARIVRMQLENMGLL